MIAIKAENLGKRYMVHGASAPPTLRYQRSASMFGKRKRKEFWALKNVSFEIPKARQ